MKNKSGFTVVELIVSFSLAIIIAVFLFQITINLKNLYEKSTIKTELLNKQALISREINNKFKNNEIERVLKCGSYCLNFMYTNGGSDKLILDYNNKTIQFGSYTVKLPSDSYFETATIGTSYSGTFINENDNAMILINVPVYNDKLKDQNFGINIVYQYNTNENDIYLSDFSSSSNEIGYLQLKGETDIIMADKDTYTESGYVVVNSDGEELTDVSVTVNNPLSSLSKPYPVGKYKIEYILSYDGVVVHKLYRNIEIVKLDADFDYTGGEQVFIVQKTGQYKLEVWGAQGGYRSKASNAGKGGYSYGTINLIKGDKLYIHVGGSGNSGTCSSNICKGGYNGGGYRYKHKGGGGATDIRFVSNSNPLNKTSLLSRVIVAGGGGSDGATGKKGMFGGGTSGGNATQNYGSYGYGGTQTGHTTSVSMPSSQYTTNSSSNYPGGFGFGGFGVYKSSGYAGAGGGGWYGGCGSVPDSSGDDDRGGGGGSGYVYTSSSSKPSGYSVDSKYYLTNASTQAGNKSFIQPNGSTATGKSGNGYARITYIGE